MKREVVEEAGLKTLKTKFEWRERGVKVSKMRVDEGDGGKSKAPHANPA